MAKSEGVYNNYIKIINELALIKEQNRLLISENKQLKKIKEFSENINNELNEIINFLPDATFAINREGTIIAWNNAMEKLTGANASDVLGKGNHMHGMSVFGQDRLMLADFLLHPDETLLNEFYNQYSFDGDRLTADGIITNKEGIKLHIWGVAKLLNDNSGHVTGAIETLRDVTYRTKMQQKITEVILETEEAERQRIAHDLHDDLGPMLSAIMLYIDKITDESTATKERKETSRYLKQVVNETVNRTRFIANNIMPSVLEDYGFEKTLMTYCEKIQSVSGIKIKLLTDGLKRDYNRTMEIVLYRVITELVNNSLKHSLAKNIIISFNQKLSLLFFEYQDDGIGFNIEEVTNNGAGLTNIKNRLTSINGIMRIKTASGEGFRLNATINIR